MKFDVDLTAGIVKAEFTVPEFLAIVGSLSGAEKVAVQPEPVFTLPVESETKPGKTYLTRIWRDIAGVQHGSCECAHHTYRGAWCKHLDVAVVVFCQRLTVKL